jgi:hypothetical protein
VLIIFIKGQLIEEAILPESKTYDVDWVEQTSMLE